MYWYIRLYSSGMRNVELDLLLQSLPGCCDPVKKMKCCQSVLLSVMTRLSNRRGESLHVRRATTVKDDMESTHDRSVLSLNNTSWDMRHPKDALRMSTWISMVSAQLM
jgi:hypothetical protein